MKIKLPKITISNLKFKIIKDLEFNLPAIYEAKCFPAVNHCLLLNKNQQVNLQQKLIDNPECFSIIATTLNNTNQESILKFGNQHYAIKYIARGELGMQLAVYKYRHGLMYHFEVSVFVRTELLERTMQTGDILILAKKI